jgi:RNA polymerase sigma factor (sigma-70 family)
MKSRVESDTLYRMLPACNTNPQDRATAWDEWEQIGGSAVRNFIRTKNYSPETDDDIYQEVMTTAYLEVERGRYQPMPGIPFAAYVKGIARNKIREASRRGRRWAGVALEDVAHTLADSPRYQPEIAYEQTQQRAHLYRGLDELPAGRRQVFARIIQGQDTAEIAAAMQITEDLVRQHKSRGLRRLREFVIGQGG